MSRFQPKQSKKEEMEEELLFAKSRVHSLAGRLARTEAFITRKEKTKEWIEFLLDSSEFKDNPELYETSLEHFMLVRTAAELTTLRNEQTFLIDAVAGEKALREQLQTIYNRVLELEKTKRDAAKKET